VKFQVIGGGGIGQQPRLAIDVSKDAIWVIDLRTNARIASAGVAQLTATPAMRIGQGRGQITMPVLVVAVPGLHPLLPRQDRPVLRQVEHRRRVTGWADQGKAPRRSIGGCSCQWRHGLYRTFGRRLLPRGGGSGQHRCCAPVVRGVAPTARPLVPGCDQPDFPRRTVPSTRSAARATLSAGLVISAATSRARVR
jgi:hypothetical protein